MNPGFDFWKIKLSFTHYFFNYDLCNKKVLFYFLHLDVVNNLTYY